MIPAQRFATDVPASTAVFGLSIAVLPGFCRCTAHGHGCDLDLDPVGGTEFPGTQEIWLAGEL